VWFTSRQRDRRSDLLGRAPGQRLVDRGSPALDQNQSDLVGGDGGRPLGDRRSHSFGGGSRAIPAGDRPPVLSREVQVRPGHAEDESGGRQSGRPDHAGQTAAGRGGRGLAGRVGSAVSLRALGKGVSPRGLSRAHARPANPGHGQSAGGSAPADADGATLPCAGGGCELRSRDRRHDRPWG